MPKKGAWAMEKDAPAMDKGTRATDEGEKATENVTRAIKKGALVTEKGAWAKEKGEQVTEKAARATKNTAKGMYAGYKIKNLVLAAATNPMPVLFELGLNGAGTGRERESEIASFPFSSPFYFPRRSHATKRSRHLF